MASDKSGVSSSKYDLVVFGATGFTGQFVVEEIAKTIDEESGLTWAVAGRNMKKLQDVLAKAGAKTGALSHADSQIGPNLENLSVAIVVTEQLSAGFLHFQLVLFQRKCFRAACVRAQICGVTYRLLAGRH